MFAQIRSQFLCLLLWLIVRESGLHAAGSRQVNGSVMILHSGQYVRWSGRQACCRRDAPLLPGSPADWSFCVFSKESACLELQYGWGHLEGTDSGLGAG